MYVNKNKGIEKAYELARGAAKHMLQPTSSAAVNTGRKIVLRWVVQKCSHTGKIPTVVNMQNYFITYQATKKNNKSKHKIAYYTKEDECNCIYLKSGNPLTIYFLLQPKEYVL